MSRFALTLLAFTALAMAGAVAAASPAGRSASTPSATPDVPAPTIVQAEPETAETLLQAIGMPDLLAIMREEGLAYAEDLAGDMFPGRGGPAWQAQVDRIYDTDQMAREMSRETAARLTEAEIDTLTQFFGSDLGQRIIALEISARQALLDPAIEAAAEEAYAEMEAQDDPRLAALSGFVTANDLVEMNVVGALNSNWAFYQGLEAGGAFDGRMSQDQMLAEVWGQEDEIRAETELWVYSYLGLAYRPLSDDDLATYTALSETPEGEALNTALFAAFDVMFTRISRELGLAAATRMAGEDI